ncbi:MAG: abscisic acid-deficient protein Aba4 family protein [Rhizomicrobium sp.]
MTPDTIFAIANNGILVFWLLLIVAPSWRGTQILVHSVAIPVLLGLTYIWLLSSAVFGGHGAPVGAWEARDARRRGISHLALVPCLIVTLMVGPVGLLLYLALRAALGKGGFFLGETAA